MFARMDVGVILFGVKMALRLSMASNCACVLSFVMSAWMAFVRAQRQWMIRSSGVKIGHAIVGCWKTTVLLMTTCWVEFLITLYHW